MEKYELVKDIGAGNFGVARLMKVKNSKELVAMKYIERGPKVRLLSVWFTFQFLSFPITQISKIRNPPFLPSFKEKTEFYFVHLDIRNL